MLELGTGTGLLGIFAALKLQQLNRSNYRIVLTDLEKPSLDITDENVALNGLPASQVSTEYFRWGEHAEETGVEKDFGGKAREYDLILGSDVIYSNLAALPFAKSVGYLLSDSGTAIVANDTIRYTNYEETFQNELEKNGLEIVKKDTL